MVSAEFSLKDKKALVAGDSRFWSKYIARALAEAGADVAIAAGNTEKTKEAAAEVEGLGRQAVAITTDLAQAGAVAQMMDTVIKDFGRLDILVNATDRMFAKPFLEMSDKEWQDVMTANLTPVILCCREAGRHMSRQKNGRIINITSGLAERGLPNSAAYCVASGGVLQLTRTLSLEWARDGITVNAVGTGWFAESESSDDLGKESLLHYLPIRRFGKPSEIGSMVVYLASDSTSFVSGQFLFADGGVMVHP